jgi:hypothetical protein
MFLRRRGRFRLRPEKSQRIIPLANVYSQLLCENPLSAEKKDCWQFATCNFLPTAADIGIPITTWLSLF